MFIERKRPSEQQRRVLQSHQATTFIDMWLSSAITAVQSGVTPSLFVAIRALPQLQVTCSTFCGRDVQPRNPFVRSCKCRSITSDLVFLPLLDCSSTV